MKRAFVFPGQGSQFVGMGKELYQAFPEAKDVFLEVDDALNQKLSTIMFEGPAEDLTATENTQPALMASSVAVVRVLEKQSGKDLSAWCDFVAGHSLGEYSALCAAGAISLRDTALLLRTRGNAMQQAVPKGKGGMAALIGVDFDKAKEVADAAAAGELVCEAANDNGGGQVVISGSMEAIDKAVSIASEFGARKAVKLPVSAPFHCSMMTPAADVMKEALAAVNITAPSVPLVANVTAAVSTDPEEIRANLVAQVTGTVRWRETVNFLHQEGVEQFVECGAGKVLAGLVKRIDRSLNAVSLQEPGDIEAFLA